jgi:hypothetical protein
VTILQLRGVSLAIKNSSTIALPKWYEVLESLGLMLRIMPRDVSTRWNSTYDMVEFATEYRAALDIMTADRNMNLRKFELSKKEWGMTTELCEVLQVCPLQPFFVNELIYLLYQIFKHGTLFFFTQLTQHQHCYSSHGPHRRILDDCLSEHEDFQAHPCCRCSRKANTQPLLQQNRPLGCL